MERLALSTVFIVVYKSQEERVKKVLVTGSEGLVGSALTKLLGRRGVSVLPLDIALPINHPGHGDIMDFDFVSRRLDGCDGVVHLAAVSRVVAGQRNPELCWNTNVHGTANVLNAALDAPSKPWVIVVSSREIYGEPQSLPVREDARAQPVNIYGRSKLEGERIALEARNRGLSVGVVRLSNVYGSVQDHPDRVVPAFARAAAEGGTLRVQGSENTFDFTHLDDTVAGLFCLAEQLSSGQRAIPPLHLVAGHATTLAELASLAVTAAGTSARIIEEPPRDYDVCRFRGDPTMTSTVLNWHAEINILEGMRRLVGAFKQVRELT